MEIKLIPEVLLSEIRIHPHLEVALLYFFLYDSFCYLHIDLSSLRNEHGKTYCIAKKSGSQEGKTSY